MVDKIDLIISILIAILTGGVIILLIELLHLHSVITDRYYSMIKPFIHKLTNYIRYTYWVDNAIIYKDKEQEYVMRLQSLVHTIKNYASDDILQGKDLLILELEPQQITTLCESINNIWYFLCEKHNYVRPYLDIDNYALQISQGTRKKALKRIMPEYAEQEFSLDQLADVSGEFYSGFFCP